VPNFVSFATSIAELAHKEKSHTQSLNQSVNQLINQSITELVFKSTKQVNTWLPI